MNYIDPKRVTWSTALPTNSYTMSTSISGTITADRIAEEIDRKLKQIEKEHEMADTYKGRTMVDISPGKSAYVKYMDNIIKINNTREFNITHECPGEPMRIELVVDSVETTRVNHYTPGLGEVYYEWTPAPRVVPKKTPWLDKRTTPKKVIFSGPATTILWKDGTKTTVKC